MDFSYISLINNYKERQIMSIETIKELKEAIKNLPDDMLVQAYTGGNGNLYPISYWLITKDTLTEEEIKDGYPNGVTPTFVISVD